MFWQIRSRLQEEVVVDWIEGTKLVVRNGMTGATGNIYCGLHEFVDMSFVLHALRPGDLFVDVGANVGSYTVLAAGVVGAKAIAIEPDAETASRLASNIAINDIDVLVDTHQTAVGDKVGTIAFTLGQDTTNHVARPSDKRTQIVPLTRLDDLLEGHDPTLIKLDVEEYETSVLKGAEQTLSKPSLLAVLIETVDFEAQKILNEHGFELYGYDPQQRKILEGFESLGAANSLYLRPSVDLEHRLRIAPHRLIQGISL